MAYTATESITCWFRSTFCDHYEASDADGRQEMDAVLNPDLDAESDFRDYCENFFTLFVPDLPSILFTAISNSVDWDALRAGCAEDVKEFYS
jgi:hypothetical protein